jgi:hypothetical protein
MNNSFPFWRVGKLLALVATVQVDADEQEAGVAVNAIIDWYWGI